MIELNHKRQHNVKEFIHPTEAGKRIMHVGSGNYHYFDGKDFKDIPNLPFPEGKIIESEKDLEMVAIPDWGEAKIEENGSVVRIYDKKNVPIYRFHNPTVVKNGTPLFQIIAPDGKQKEEVFAKDLTAKKDKLLPNEKMEVIENNIVERPIFEIKDNKICFKLSKPISEQLQAYDDTDTSSTNNKNASLEQGGSNGTAGYIANQGATSNWRMLQYFTLPSGTGSISDIKLYLYKAGNSGTSAMNINAHTCTRNDWVQAEVTWFIYKTSNNWTNSGGDFNSTIIDAVARTTTSNEWHVWGLLGSTADNPLTKTWGDTINLLLKCSEEGTSKGWEIFNMKSSETNKPYLEITYTTGSPRSHAYIIH